MKITKPILVLILLAAAIALPLMTESYFITVAITILTFMSLALSWDMMLRTGQLSFGTAGFFGLGGYAGIIAVADSGVDPITGIIIAGLVAGIVSLVLGMAILRLRGLYFAITTMALASVFMVIIRNIHKISGGPSGKVVQNTLFNYDSNKVYWFMLGIAVVTIIVSEVFQRTRIHFAIDSIRADETVAKSHGVNIYKYLIFVFVITSIIQGVIGATYALQYGFVFPESSFSAHYLLLPIAMALVGGIYSTVGSVIGAIILGLSSEYLKLIMPYGHLIIYGVIIVVVVLFLPNGVYGAVKDIMGFRKRRLEER
ncbi:MAG: branched-chain amino acid ABC transporter permease [Mesotoga sp.]|jgi:branched-chain amino acid transport system permease protein|uniref:branched-chain amino acid ABC transporter permease n=1 Tax=Mesotoga sp. TaxID=2053577 RepID=UPI0016985A83|nr:branched-chain amino acid ABC transporter permease [Mesotoga sp.]MDI9368506.1 branched-chain amino acid ABC transporter permease [Thermotogota bacterium]NLT46180.1 branched-chain amino acid ABC transporter permease [Thermotogaceae bacterium]MDD2332818.1 branched-chain amino acid ABC transporter permease [Mesotoga sp.]MDD3680069.1 branched-chain amino acid ABC transporter permease [Mesotoga sp.]MDD4206677.1 branched-chain amino acid ABC transporter permease [Mesotoga sp.]